MVTNRLFWGGAVAASLLLTTAVAVVSTDSTQDAGPDRAESSTQPQSNRQKSGVAAVARSQSTNRFRRPASPAPDAPEVIAAEEAPAPSAPTFEEEQARLRGYRAQLDATVASEARDQGWANQAEWDLNESLTTGLAGLSGRVETLECFSEHCRMKLSFGNSDEQAILMDRISGAPGFDRPGWAHLDSEEGQPVAYMYTARSGDVFDVEQVAGGTARD